MMEFYKELERAREAFADKGDNAYNAGFVDGFMKAWELWESENNTDSDCIDE